MKSPTFHLSMGKQLGSRSTLSRWLLSVSVSVVESEFLMTQFLGNRYPALGRWKLEQVTRILRF